MNGGPVAVGGGIALAMLGAAMVLSLVRLLRGPSLPDRVVALDLIATHVVGFIAVITVMADQPVFLRAAIVLALLAFLGTVAFAHYIGRSRGR